MDAQWTFPSSGVHNDHFSYVPYSAPLASRTLPQEPAILQSGYPEASQGLEYNVDLYSHQPHNTFYAPPPDCINDMPTWSYTTASSVPTSITSWPDTSTLPATHSHPTSPERGYFPYLFPQPGPKMLPTEVVTPEEARSNAPSESSVATSSNTRTSPSRSRHGQRDGPHECLECGEEFSHFYKLNRHTKRHTRPYVCQHAGCSRAFTLPKDLRRHLRTHATGVTRIPACYCPVPTCECSVKGFTRKDNLLRHMKRAHGVSGPEAL
ncbi:hypothetical protein BDY21DRAFT_373880 [Lineolata rhizophorae]|uniref:C2H2-type domain-containing protein n=1 Tax=Lineolata rhizophorae TaxID=578093 RepID=A0A6A6NS98_9PEZI|nr:hypothetical protein BDY21DRAFT_373880 [Lineolata rhizophorae]